MKKIFCLCLIITLGAHSIQAGIRDNIFKYASATTKGVGAIIFGLASGGCLFLSFGMAAIFPEGVEKAKQNFEKFESEERSRYAKRSVVTVISVMGIAGIGCGYVAYKLGRSSLKDISLLAKKAGIHIKVKKAPNFSILPMYGEKPGISSDVFYTMPRI